MTDPDRRRLLAAAGPATAALMAIAATGAQAGEAAPPRVQMWEQETCPGCSLLVYFLPGQQSNRCGHCQTTVGRA